MNTVFRFLHFIEEIILQCYDHRLRTTDKNIINRIKINKLITERSHFLNRNHTIEHLCFLQFTIKYVEQAQAIHKTVFQCFQLFFKNNGTTVVVSEYQCECAFRLVM
ncbi:hypothetical protein D9M68_838510 [compost metagenome]